MSKKTVITAMDYELNKLTHVSKIKNLNIFVKDINDKKYDSLLLDKSKKDIEYILKPGFNFNTDINLDNKNGLLNCFLPIYYYVNYGTINVDFKSEINKNFTGVRISKLPIDNNTFQIHAENYEIDSNMFNNVYNSLLRYLYSEKNYHGFTNNDLIWLFRETLELCYYNHYNNIDYIVDGKKYSDVTKFLRTYSINMLDKPIKTSESYYKPWIKVNTYLDNRKMVDNKVLTLKKQQKLD